jgi:hypothetical protein
MGRQTEQIEFGQAKWLVKWGDLWCRIMHPSPMWPIHGHYQCGACGRSFSVPWEEDSSVHARAGLVGFGPALASIRK